MGRISGYLKRKQPKNCVWVSVVEGRAFLQRSQAVGIAETTLQKRLRSSYFDKPSEQSAGCRLVRTPEISVGIFFHLSALSLFALSGCGHRDGTGSGQILFHPNIVN